MTRTSSLYLDIVRFLAALSVFLSHIASWPFTERLNWHGINAYGDVGVIIFFVLSGYVIAYVVSTREQNASEYFAARIARLYSVVLIALILTFTMDSFGQLLNPSFYEIHKVLWKPVTWSGYLASALFVNEYQAFGFHGISPGTNGPFWSLSFEATYYWIAGLFLFFRKWVAIPVSILIFSIAGKAITVLLPIWLLGYGLYHLNSLTRIPRTLARALFLISGFAIIAMPIITNYLPIGSFGFRVPWGRGQWDINIADDYMTASVFGIHLLVARDAIGELTINRRSIQKFIRQLGLVTFPLYLLHYPAISLVSAISPWPRSSGLTVIAITLFVTFLVLVTTPVCESFKHAIRNRLLVFLSKYQVKSLLREKVIQKLNQET